MPPRSYVTVVCPPPLECDDRCRKQEAAAFLCTITMSLHYPTGKFRINTSFLLEKDDFVGESATLPLHGGGFVVGFGIEVSAGLVGGTRAVVDGVLVEEASIELEVLGRGHGGEGNGSNEDGESHDYLMFVCEGKCMRCRNVHSTD
ncbi:hypothetical protein PM082_023028 [Marasmius tenuissimus]|nr:hypothetical protein PM082_023028 [Marasmius tenuissimus]